MIFVVGVMFLSYSSPPALDNNVSPHQTGERITAAASEEETYDGDQGTIVPEFEEYRPMSGGLFGRALRRSAIVDFLMGGSQVSLMRGHLPLPPPHSVTPHYVHRSVSYNEFSW